MVSEIEEHRHRCEVRQILRWRKEKGREYVFRWFEGGGDKGKSIAALRGQEAADRLWSECAAQWSAGNRGEKGYWRVL